MIIGITGTTSGIGKAIIGLPYKFVTFNRSDGDNNTTDITFELVTRKDVIVASNLEEVCVAFFYN